MTLRTIELDRIVLPDGAADLPIEATPPPPLSPFPDGPLMVWQIDDECYLAIGSIGFVRELRRLGRPTASCLVLEGDTLEDAKKTIFSLSAAVVAEAMVHMDGSMYDIAHELGTSKTFVGRLVLTWNRATPKLRDLWAKGLSTNRAIKLAKETSLEQNTALHDITDPSQIPTLVHPAYTVKKKGAPRGPRKRPPINRLKKFLSLLEEHKSKDDYEKGVLDTLRYVIAGQISTDSRWGAYTGIDASHGRFHRSEPLVHIAEHDRGDGGNNRSERIRPGRGHDPVDRESDLGSLDQLAGR